VKCIKKSNLSLTLLGKRRALGYQKFNWDFPTLNSLHLKRLPTTMAPSIVTPELPTSPVAEGKVPAAFTTKDAKDLPETLLSHFTDSINGKTTNGPESTTSDRFTEHSVPFNEQYALNPRKLRIITIGAGFSGLVLAHKFQHAYPELQDFVDHTIFEGRSDIGGTWLVNTYPGVQCDVPSHIYVRLRQPSPFQGWELC
jgi:hypothetical protein